MKTYPNPVVGLFCEECRMTPCNCKTNIPIFKHTCGWKVGQPMFTCTCMDDYNKRYKPNLKQTEQPTGGTVFRNIELAISFAKWLSNDKSPANGKTYEKLFAEFIEEIPLPTQSAKSGEVLFKDRVWEILDGKEHGEWSFQCHHKEDGACKKHCMGHCEIFKQLQEQLLSAHLDATPIQSGLNKEEIIKWIPSTEEIAREIENKTTGMVSFKRAGKICREFLLSHIASLPSTPPAQREEGEEAKRFLDWVDNSGYCSVYSQELKTGAWVDSNEHPIYTHGSDFHLTNLVKNHGITTSELYAKFKSQP